MLQWLVIKCQTPFLRKVSDPHQTFNAMLTIALTSSQCKPGARRPSLGAGNTLHASATRKALLRDKQSSITPSLGAIIYEVSEALKFMLYMGMLYMGPHISSISLWPYMHPGQSCLHGPCRSARQIRASP